MTAVKDVASNPTLQVLSRLSMLTLPLMLASITYFGGAWLDQRFGAAAATAAGLSDRVASLEVSANNNNDLRDKMQNRLGIVEVEIGHSRRLEDSINMRLDKLIDVVTSLTREVADVTAALKAEGNAK